MFFIADLQPAVVFLLFPPGVARGFVLSGLRPGGLLYSSAPQGRNITAPGNARGISFRTQKQAVSLQ